MSESPIGSTVLPYDSVTQTHLILTKLAYESGETWFQAPRLLIADRLGASLATVTKAIARLADAGFLEIRRPSPDLRRAGQGARYRLRFFLSGPSEAVQRTGVQAAAATPRQDVPVATTSHATSTASAPKKPTNQVPAEAVREPQQVAPTITPITGQAPSRPGPSANRARTGAHLRAISRALESPAFDVALGAVNRGEPINFDAFDETDADLLRAVAGAAQAIDEVDGMPMPPPSPPVHQPLPLAAPGDASRPKSLNTSVPRSVGDVLARLPVSQPPEPDQKRASIRDLARTALGRVIAAASGNYAYARVALGQILWSAKRGQLAKFGASAVDVGIRLLERNRWGWPYGLDDDEFSEILRVIDGIESGAALQG